MKFLLLISLYASYSNLAPELTMHLNHPLRSIRFALGPLLLISGLAFFSPTTVSAEKDPGGPLQTLSGCRLIDNRFNDGDSFHVSHGGKEYIFRLYYVDTPETTAHRELVKRTTEQARHWKILKRDLFVIAEMASQFTTERLQQPFTVTTRWEDARGASNQPRYFAMVRAADGEDLAEALVAAGLARVYGYAPEIPGNESPKTTRKRLETLEAKARAESVGAWAFSKKPKDSKKGASSGKSTPRPTPKAKSTPSSGNSLDSIPVF